LDHTWLLKLLAHLFVTPLNDSWFIQKIIQGLRERKVKQEKVYYYKAKGKYTLPGSAGSRNDTVLGVHVRGA
jgi:hypothetical protein